MKKRYLSMILVAVMLTLSACGSNTDSGAASGGGSQEDTASESEADDQQQEEAASTPEAESAEAESAEAESADDVIVINFATNQPTTHPVAVGYQGLVDELNEKGEGRIKATAYFAEQLGNEKELVDMTVNNVNDLLSACGPNAHSVYFPTLQLFDAPYMFRSPQHLLNFANGEASREMWDAYAEQSGVHVLGVYYYGVRELTCNDLDVQTPDDLKGFKLRVMDSPISMATGRALGANPTPLAYGELYQGMQQGVVDGQENPLAGIQSMKFYEVQNTLVMTDHVVAAVCFAMNEEKWQSIPSDIQEIIQTAVDNAVEACSNAVLDSEDALLEELKGYGMKVIEPDVDAFRANASSVIDEFSGDWMEGIYDVVQSVEG